MDDADPERRRFLQVATCAVGGGLGIVTVAPALRMCVAPARSQTVRLPTDPIDVGAIDSLGIGKSWRKIDVVAPVVSDAWTSARDVVLGAAFVRRPSKANVEALSAICPHLGCIVGVDGQGGNFLCPCHDSRWNGDGRLVAAMGPAKRDLDPLPVEVVGGRLRLTWTRYKLDTALREPA
jgi:Rieske Fe-S protein